MPAYALKNQHFLYFNYKLIDIFIMKILQLEYIYREVDSESLFIHNIHKQKGKIMNTKKIIALMVFVVSIAPAWGSALLRDGRITKLLNAISDFHPENPTDKSIKDISFVLSILDENNDCEYLPDDDRKKIVNFMNELTSVIQSIKYSENPSFDTVVKKLRKLKQNLSACART